MSISIYIYIYIYIYNTVSYVCYTFKILILRHNYVCAYVHVNLIELDILDLVWSNLYCILAIHYESLDSKFTIYLKICKRIKKIKLLVLKQNEECHD